MLKKLLNSFLNLHYQRNTILYKDIYHYAYNKHTFCNNIYIFSHSENTLQCSLRILQRMKSQHLYFWIAFTICIQLGYYQNDIQQVYQNFIEYIQHKEQKELEQNNKQPITGSSIVINEVLLKESINRMLGELIVRIDNKQSTQHNIAKQLCKLGNITFLYDKTYILTKDLLIQQVFNNEDIYIKLRNLLIKVLKDQRHQVIYLMNDVLRNHVMDIAKIHLANLYNQEGFQQGLSNALIGGLYGYLDDRKTVIELLKLLQQ